MSDELMFVYGTLRKDTASPMKPVLDQYCELLGTASMRGKLYDLGRYPGLVINEEGAGPVSGQLFRLKDVQKVLREFDYYEECSDDFPEPHLYVREKVQVIKADGRAHMAWVYIYNRPTAGHIHIQGGDYIEYLAQKSG
ncbi:MAG: gamma-glutamylcyclotransferase [Sneathiella sp.]|nr:gamma-glutamylcyclotransferase [Sneathiella sp.]